MCNFASSKVIAKTGNAIPGPSRRPNGGGEMKIFVRSENYGNFVLEVEKSHTIEDVLITLVPHEVLQSGLWDIDLDFNGSPLMEIERSLAHYGIQNGSILQLECIQGGARSDSDDHLYTAELPASVAELWNSKWDSAGEPDQFASEMKITVQSDATHNYHLLVCCRNTVEDVLVKILGSDRAGRAPEPRLFFNDLELQKQKTLAEYGIEHGSSEDYGNYALEVNSSNTIEDVLITVLGKWPGALYFNGHRLLETAKSLADYSIEDGSILHLDVFELNLVHIVSTVLEFQIIYH
uniref:Ubiquitin-like domain-containing protein n=1 Tax=Ananas comosus var. bracteatus TaxID=296719 RepID=A0A6V7QDT1_ANACO|nr:unnamed protein product [Ananas comosus var. bracteatus]